MGKAAVFTKSLCGCMSCWVRGEVGLTIAWICGQRKVRTVLSVGGVQSTVR